MILVTACRGKQTEPPRVEPCQPSLKIAKDACRHYTGRLMEKQLPCPGLDAT